MRTIVCACAAAMAACGQDGGVVQESLGAAPAEAWAWVPVAGTRCADDSPTGMGVNLTARSKHLMIYFEGGGGCWDRATCSDPLHVSGSNLDGFDGARFQRVMVTGTAEYFPPIAPGYGTTGLWDRSATQNPFRDYSYVYIPYCTGDFHSGNSPDSPVTGLSQVGYANFGADLRLLAAEFSGADKLVVVGSSAGGFGASWNYQRIRAAFPGIPVKLLDESGPPLPFKNLFGTPLLPRSLQDQWNTAWKLDATRPAASPTRYVEDVYASNVRQTPRQAIGLFASKLDPVFPLFLAGSGGVPDVFSLSIGLTNLKQSLSAYSNAKFYYLPFGIQHDYLHQPVGNWPTDYSNSPAAFAGWVTQLIQ